MIVVIKNQITGKKRIIENVTDFYFIGKDAEKLPRIYPVGFNESGKRVIMHDYSVDKSEAYQGYDFSCIAGGKHIICYTLKTHQEAKALLDYAHSLMMEEKNTGEENTLSFPDCLIG